MDSRAGLVSAALALFARRGYDAVGVQEIAQSAGVAKPTLYHFFGSKQGLLEALFDEYASRLDKQVETAAEYSGDLPLTLDRVAAAYVGFARQEPVFYRLELALHSAPLDSVSYQVAARHYSRRLAIIEGVFIKAVRQHGNMRGRHQRYALSLIGIINLYVSLQLNERLIITDRVRREMLHQFSHGIYS
jgi:AcrR family transcriptional regulator